MIARTWKGAVRRADGDEYAEYMRKTGMPGYTQTPGNLATLMLRREVGDRCEFLMFTLWDSIESVKAFAGEDPEGAVFYPEDDAFLIERDLTSSHWAVEEAVGLPVPMPSSNTGVEGPEPSIPERKVTADSASLGTANHSS